MTGENLREKLELAVVPEPEVEPRRGRHRMHRRHETIYRGGWIVCSAPDCSYMRPASRRRGCWLLPFLVVAFLVLAGSLVPAQNAPRAARTAPEPVYALPVVVGVSPVPSVVPAASDRVGGAQVGGIATWYVDPAHPDGLYAAAGPEVRGIPGWRGSTIRVTHGLRSVLVVLTDACWCPTREAGGVLVDLSRDAFSRLADPDLGVVAVVVSLVTLPATDSTGVPRTPDDLRMMLEVREDSIYR